MPNNTQPYMNSASVPKPATLVEDLQYDLLTDEICDRMLDECISVFSNKNRLQTPYIHNPGTTGMNNGLLYREGLLILQKGLDCDQISGTFYASDEAKLNPYRSGAVSDELSSMPFTRSFLESLDLNIINSRIHVAYPGVKLYEHKDMHTIYLNNGHRPPARIHIPLLTNGAVHTYGNGKKFHLPKGKMFYLHADSISHGIKFDNSIDFMNYPRVHLIFDAAPDKNLDMFLSKKIEHEHVKDLPLITACDIKTLYEKAALSYDFGNPGEAKETVLGSFFDFTLKESSSWKLLIDFFTRTRPNHQLRKFAEYSYSMWLGGS